MSASDDDFGWFSPADFEIVLRAIAKSPEPDKFVLVGGQSLVGWTLHYNIPVPPSDYPALTQDVDFVGARKEAEFLAKEIGGIARFATLDDHTPNTAVITWQPPGAGKKKLLLDFLSGILGVEDADVRRLAVPIQFFGQHPVKILHPLLCLVSRLVNLHTLAIKRTKNGITQAKMAVEVAGCYLRELLAKNTPEDEKQAIKAVHRILDAAASQAGVYAFIEYGVDPLSAIDAKTLEAFVHHPMFAIKDWPKQLAWVQRERVKGKRQHEARLRLALLRGGSGPHRK